MASSHCKGQARSRTTDVGMAPEGRATRRGERAGRTSNGGGAQDAKLAQTPVVRLERVSGPAAGVEVDSDGGDRGGGGQPGAVRRHYLDRYNVEYFRALGMEWKPDVNALRREVVETTGGVGEDTTGDSPRKRDAARRPGRGRVGRPAGVSPPSTDIHPRLANDRVPDVRPSTHVSDDPIVDAPTEPSTRASTRRSNKVFAEAEHRPPKLRTRTSGLVSSDASLPIVRPRHPTMGRCSPRHSAVRPATRWKQREPPPAGLNVAGSLQTSVVPLDSTAVARYLRQRSLDLPSRERKGAEIRVAAREADSPGDEIEVVPHDRALPSRTDAKIEPPTNGGPLFSRVLVDVPSTVPSRSEPPSRPSGGVGSRGRPGDERKSSEVEIVEEVKRTSPPLSTIFTEPPGARSQTTPSHRGSGGGEVEIVREVLRTREDAGSARDVAVETAAMTLLREVERSRKILARNRSANVILPSAETGSPRPSRSYASPERVPTIFLAARHGDTSKQLITCPTVGTSDVDDVGSVDSALIVDGSRDSDLSSPSPDIEANSIPARDDDVLFVGVVSPGSSVRSGSSAGDAPPFRRVWKWPDDPTPPTRHDKSSQTDPRITRSWGRQTSETSGEDTTDVPSLRRHSGRSGNEDRKQSETKPLVRPRLENWSGDDESLAIESSDDERSERDGDVVHLGECEVEDKARGGSLRGTKSGPRSREVARVESGDSDVAIASSSDEDDLDDDRKESGRSKRNLKHVPAQEVTLVEGEGKRTTGGLVRTTRRKHVGDANVNGSTSDTGRPDDSSKESKRKSSRLSVVSKAASTTYVVPSSSSSSDGSDSIFVVKSTKRKSVDPVPVAGKARRSAAGGDGRTHGGNGPEDPRDRGRSVETGARVSAIVRTTEDDSNDAESVVFISQAGRPVGRRTESSARLSDAVEFIAEVAKRGISSSRWSVRDYI